jgi:hypothetical protein
MVRVRPLHLLLATFLLAASHPWVQAQAPPNGDAVVVELIEAGAAPRQEIRFRPKPGTKQTAVMTVKLDQSMIIDDAKRPSASIPPQKFTMEATVTDVSPEGDIQFKFEYIDIDLVDDPAAPSPIAATMRTLLKPLVGATGSAVVSNRGITRKGELNIPPDLSPRLKSLLDGMKDSMNRLSSPVPAEPIGLGGKWRVTQNVVANGLKLKQTSIHELTGVDENGFTIGITLTQQADPQRISSPSVPQAATVMLESLATEGSGSMSISPDSILPIRSQVNIVSNTKMNVTVADTSQAIATEMKMEMTFAPAEARAASPVE